MSFSPPTAARPMWRSFWRWRRRPTPRFLDVHRYLAGSDYLFTTNPQAEASRLQLKGYRHLGIAFRLFAPGTPGTTDFFRWFNPVKGRSLLLLRSEGGQAASGLSLRGIDRKYRHLPSDGDTRALPLVQSGQGRPFLHDGPGRRRARPKRDIASMESPDLSAEARNRK